MSVPSIAAYTAPAATTQAKSTTSTNSKNELSMQDFFTLLAAQLSNQDMNNPVDSTQFISQMAQFSALSATQELSSTVSNLSAVSYIGKNIKATQIDSNGVATYINGIAEKVEFLSGETYITVDGNRVSTNEITQVS
ncbi:MAG: flagellar hook capping FlgD N-terminal domain-containing protein [Oscillospiraceae bacterium]|nr:flagellar hook capping FlgD N-terminal domain-containing protein [Oscillospiraceae bacterium]